MTPPFGSALGAGPEFDLIRSVLSKFGGGGQDGIVGPGDDAAVFRTDASTVVSTDLTIEGVHFRANWLTPREVGYRATAAALSDLAAMAARPIGILLSLAVDVERAEVWIPALADGANEALGDVGGVLLGGDLSRTPQGGPVMIDVVVLGETDSPVTRSGAQPGDSLWVTGRLGRSALALSEWEAGRTPTGAVRERFVRPTPRVQEALWLNERAQINAMIDISDGLASDVGHIAAASGVQVEVDASHLPLVDELMHGTGSEEARMVAANSGEEYELCLTSPGGELEALSVAFEARFAVPLTRVGKVKTGGGVRFLGIDSDTFASGHDHFRPRPRT